MQSTTLIPIWIRVDFINKRKKAIIDMIEKGKTQ
jgi:hypothetical protein